MKLLKSIFSFGKNNAYKDAIDLYNRCMYNDAIKKFEKILKEKASVRSLHHTLSNFYCGQAYRNVGEICYALGGYGNAAVSFKKALTYSPNNVELYHYLGLSYSNLNDVKSANAAFTKVMQQAPDCLEPRSKLGVVFFHLGTWNNAVAAFKKVLSEKPEYADIHYHLGLSYLGQGDPESASTSFKQAISINPSYSKAIIKYCLTRFYLKKLDDAPDILMKEIGKYPNRADLHYIAGIMHNLDNDIEKSMKSYKTAISINPSYQAPRIKLGILLCHIGQMTAGIRELENAYELVPKDKPLVTTLQSLKKICQSDTTGELHTECVCRLLPGNETETLKQIGEFRHYFSATPDFADMLSILSRLPQSESFLQEQLIPILQETLEIHPGYSDIHNSLGTFYLKVGKYNNAIASFKEAKRINPQYHKARINLFNVLKNKGDLQEALDEGTELLKNDLPYPDFLCAVGEIYMSMGKFEDAWEIVKNAFDQNPKSATTNFLLAQIHHKRGDEVKSAEMLKRCIETESERQQSDA